MIKGKHQNQKKVEGNFVRGKQGCGNEAGRI